MVNGGGAELYGKLDPGAIAKLIAMHAQPQPRRTACLQYPARLGFIKRAALTKDVNPAHVWGNLLKHGADYFGDIFFGICSWRDQMGAQEGHVFNVSGGNLCGFELGLGVEPVAGLGFKGGGAPGVACLDALNQKSL